MVLPEAMVEKFASTLLRIRRICYLLRAGMSRVEREVSQENTVLQV